MADKNDKSPKNVAGPYYVDFTCIDCDLCRAMAPGIFRRDDETGFTFESCVETNQSLRRTSRRRGAFVPRMPRAMGHEP